MCCLFGLIDYGNVFSAREKNKIIKILSTECETRGTDATGIAFNTNTGLHIFKRPLAAHQLWYRIPDNARVIMGHTRMTTQGSEKFNFNNHPFPGRVGVTNFALAHNGVLHNDIKLQRKPFSSDKFEELYQDYLSRKICKIEFAKLLGVSRPTLNRLIGVRSEK